MGLRWAVAGTLGFVILAGAACDPLTGTGPGTPPDPKAYIHADAAARAVVITLIAGYPAGDYQFNYNGYRDGTLVISVPVGWQVTVQCENHATVPNSCAVVRGSKDSAPIQPGWSTPDPTRGLDPGGSATFAFSPSTAGSFRIASLVGGNEASGMWADLEVTPSGAPTIKAEA
jgi:Sulfocyanin (SoxE) domain